MKLVAVYCASASNLSSAYKDDARALGLGLASTGIGMVYGGGSVGLMGEIARAVHENAGFVAGYIPDKLMAIEGRAYDIADELIITETMQERKRSIFERVDAFVALPGGMGTMEEFMEVATLRKLGYHDKPIVLVNTAGFWDGLLEFLEYTRQTGFSPDFGPIFSVADDAAQCLTLLQTHFDGLSTETPTR